MPGGAPGGRRQRPGWVILKNLRKAAFSDVLEKAKYHCSRLEACKVRACRVVSWGPNLCGVS